MFGAGTELWAGEDTDDAGGGAVDARHTLHTLSGVVPRTIAEIFNRRGHAARVSLSVLEVYNEEVFDLMRDPNSDEFAAAPLQAYESVGGDGSLLLPGALSVVATNTGNALRLLAKAMANRRVSATYGCSVLCCSLFVPSLLRVSLLLFRSAFCLCE